MSIFREYDIRGVADRDLIDPIVFSLGRILARRALKAGDRNIFVGEDVRISSDRLAATLSAAFRFEGLQVRRLNPGPTPLLYFAAKVEQPNFPTQSGVMITGSHNPPEYNGFKMVIGGNTLFGEDIQEIAREVQPLLANFDLKEFESAKTLAVERVNREEEYVRFLKENIRPEKKLKVVVDAGNGAAGPLAVATYKALGFEVIPLFCEFDGSFPNHHPDPTVPKNLVYLQDKVRSTGADLGIGFDGDGDRIGAVTSTGQIVYGDQLVLYFSRDILKNTPGATIISEVKSSKVLYDTLAKWGAKPIIWKTGHSLIKAKLKETKAALAGEMSGHMFFADRYFGFDDALYAGARLLEGLSQRDESLDEFLASLPPAVNTPELRIDYPDSKKFTLVKEFVRRSREKFGNQVLDIDGARISFPKGWGLLRASNTQPVLVMRFEAENLPSLQAVSEEFALILKDIDASIEIPPL